MAQNKHKGGLGRGLAALIPNGPTTNPRLGDGAADILLGGKATEENDKKTRAQHSTTHTTRATHATTSTTTKAKRATKRATQTVKKTTDTSRATGTQRNDTQPQLDIGASYLEIPVGDITPNPRQPRQVFDEEALAELVHSIKEFGLMQPIVVRRAADDSGYEIIMGERRWRAASKAGLTTIPAIVRETDDSAMLRNALLENIHRVQLNPLEEAAAYHQLLEEFGVTQAELAQRLGRSRPMITNMIRLLQLPVSVQRKVAAGVLSAGHARALLGLVAGPEAQEGLANRVVAEGMSVRATEEMVTLMNRGDAVEQKKTKEKPPQPEFLTRAADRLADGLDTKVTVSMGKRKGKIVVEFGDRDDFERIMAIINTKN